MENYIAGNKEAWEEAFDNRSASWGADVSDRLREPKEDYPFFEKEMIPFLKKTDSAGKVIGQFCCNNGRELLSFVRCGGAKLGIGFDIAENQIAFANGKAAELGIPCRFEAVNVYEIGDEYRETFDVVLITIGALCWFDDLDRFFAVVSRCMKPGAVLLIHEQHPCTNMIASESESEYDPAHPLDPRYSYFEHKWTGNDGMFYMTGRSYPSKTFTDFTHSLSEIMTGICRGGIVITGFWESDTDICGMFSHLERRGYPLSMIIEGRKEEAK